MGTYMIWDYTVWLYSLHLPYIICAVHPYLDTRIYRLLWKQKWKKKKKRRKKEREVMRMCIAGSMRVYVLENFLLLLLSTYYYETGSIVL